MLTDADEFQFIYLNTDRKLFTSRPLRWYYDKNQIVQWVDRVLEDSIKASPHTTPLKSMNTSLRAYQTELKRNHIFGDPSKDDSGKTEGEKERPVKVVWKGKVLTVVECEDSDHSDDLEDTGE